MARSTIPRTHGRRRRKLARIQFELAFEGIMSRAEGVRELALLGIRSLVIINGGALIGLFTFLGNNQALASRAFAFGVLAASVAFVLGLVTALIAVLIAYRIELENVRADLAQIISEVMQAHDIPEHAPPQYPHRAAPSGAWAIISLTLFVIGSLTALGSVLL